MGLTEAKKYITDLHRRQKDPMLWPDFLTGLPDKTAILRKMEEVFPRLGRYTVAYVRISNIQPYLIKYGPDRHAEIIQWAAAILKTSADACSEGFAGTINTHDFIVICKSDKTVQILSDAAQLFRKRMRTYYSEDDIASESTLSFRNAAGQNYRAGLLGLVNVIADRKLSVTKSDLVLNMARVCDALEKTDRNMVNITEEMISRA